MTTGGSAPDAAIAIAQLRDVQREVLRLRDEVDSVTRRLGLMPGTVLWSGVAADAWRDRVQALGRDSARGVESLEVLHRLVGAVIARVEEGVVE